MSTATGLHTGRAIYTGLTAAGTNQATALQLAGRSDSLQELTTVTFQYRRHAAADDSADAGRDRQPGSPHALDLPAVGRLDRQRHHERRRHAGGRFRRDLRGLEPDKLVHGRHHGGRRRLRDRDLRHVHRRRHGP